MKFTPSRTALAALVCLLASCDRKTEEKKAGPTVPKVKTGTVEMRTFADEVEALGTVRALEAIDISANVTETVTAVSFEDGQTVKKGAILAQLSDEEERAMLAGAEINLVEQEREVNRLRELANNGAVSRVRLQEYLTARDLALQKIEEAKAKIADRAIVAPFSGVLGFRQVSVGTLVSPGEVLATLDLIDTVKLDFSVPETFLGGLTPGEKISARSEAFPDRMFEGVVTDINARVNPITRSAIVRAEIPNPDHLLRPGMLLTTRIKKNPATSTTVPERALVSIQSRHSIFRIEGEGEAATALETPVRIGRRIPGYVEVLEGLNDGDTIVVDGLLGIKDGSSLNIIGEANAPAPPYNPTDSDQATETPAKDTGAID
ncbi:efflux RND transporter periplasmic adaptor subunit [Verrucomicrobiaceae bacterium 227]